MIAMMLAAGNGMRLRPLTNDIQKCLLPINGKPMLEWWLDAVFGSSEFNEVFVNVHYLATDVIRWLYRYEIKTGNKIHIIDEQEKLLGTAGTLKNLPKEEDFMIAYTDTFSEQVLSDIGSFVKLWKNQRDDFLAGLISFNPPNDGSASFITLDSIGRVLEFREKADHGDVSWMGTMFGKPEFLECIKPDDKDLARDVLPRLQGKIRVISHVKAYDIGRGVEHYERFRDSFKQTALSA